MKKLFRHFVIETTVLLLVSRIAEGLVFEEGIKTLLYAGLGLTAASMLAKPVINILLLPINLVTFNLFRWISSAIALYLVTLLVPGFQIIGFSFPGLTSSLINLPQIAIGGFLAYVMFSLLISLVTSFIYWVVS